ncbi:MAG: ion transporter [Candidatus Pacebacteria bacterium]|nr:ion transporter [Candidatus Paceibacterota bacterium]
MEEQSELLETINRIRSDTLRTDGVELLITSQSPTRKVLLIYYIWTHSDKNVISEVKKYMRILEETRELVREDRPNDELLPLLAQKALTAAIELDLYDLAVSILHDAQPTVSSECILLLFTKGRTAFLRDIIKLKLQVEGVRHVRSVHDIAHIITRYFSPSPANVTVPSVFDLAEFALLNSVDFGTIIDFCIDCRDCSDSSALNFLLRHGKEDEALALLTVYRKVNGRSLLLALQLKCFKYAVEFSRRKESIAQARQSVFDCLFRRIGRELESEIGNLEVYLYIVRRYISFTECEDAAQFAEAMQEMLDTRKVKSAGIQSVLNPVKTIVELIEIAIHLRARFEDMRMLFDGIIRQLTRLGLSIMGEIKFDRQIKFVLFDKDLEGRDVLSLILKYNLIDFFNHPLFERISNEVWNGPCQFTRNPLAPTSTLLRLASQSLTDKQDAELKIRRKFLLRKVETMSTHAYEFSVWRNSAGLRVFFLALEYTMLTIGLFVSEVCLRFQFTAMQDMREATASQVTPTGYPATMTTEEREIYLRHAILARNIAFCWDIFGISILVGASRAFLVPAFLILTKRRHKLVTVDWTLDAIVLLSMALLYIPINGNGGLGIADLNKTGEEVVTKVESTDDNKLSSILVAVIITCLGVRLIYLMRFTSFLGPLICIIQSMFQKVVQFCIFFFIVLFIFALAATLLFPSTEEGFERIDYIVLTLFQSSVGVFDLNPPSNYSVEGKVFYVVFVFVVSIMLLNLIVAILNDVYSNMSAKSQSIYHREIIALRDRFRPHRRYQFMVSSFYVMDIFASCAVLPVFPLLTAAARERANTFLLYFEYTFCFAVMFPFYLLAEILLIPVAYLMTLTIKLKEIFRVKADRLGRAGSAAFFLVLGPVMLVGYMFGDIFYCVLHAYMHRPSSALNKEGSDYVPERVLKDLIDLLETSKVEQVDCNALLQALEASFGKCDKNSIIKQLILPGRDKLVWIAQFAVLSTFIRHLSTFSVDPSMVDTKLLSAMLTSLLRTEELRRYLKRGAAKARAQAPRAKVYPLRTFVLVRSQTTEGTEPDDKGDDSKKVRISALKIYDRELHNRGLDKYSAEQSTVADMLVELRSFKTYMDRRLSALFSRSRTVERMSTIHGDTDIKIPQHRGSTKTNITDNTNEQTQ